MCPACIHLMKTITCTPSIPTHKYWWGLVPQAMSIQTCTPHSYTPSHTLTHASHMHKHTTPQLYTLYIHTLTCMYHTYTPSNKCTITQHDYTHIHTHTLTHTHTHTHTHAQHNTCTHTQSHPVRVTNEVRTHSV